MTDYKTWGPADWVVVSLVAGALAVTTLQLALAALGLIGLLCSRIYSLGKGR